MNAFKKTMICVGAIAIVSCSKDKAIKSILIPNGDFENWNNLFLPYNWTTNSCPACVPAYKTYMFNRIRLHTMDYSLQSLFTIMFTLPGLRINFIFHIIL